MWTFFLFFQLHIYVFLLLFSLSVMSSSLQPHGLQDTSLPSPLPSPRVCSNSCPLSWWCCPTISSSVIPFSSCLQSFPPSGSFPISRFFASGGWGIGASTSASVLPMNIQVWFPLQLTGLISLQSRELSRLFSNTRVQMHQYMYICLPKILYQPPFGFHGGSMRTESTCNVGDTGDVGLIPG